MDMVYEYMQLNHPSPPTNTHTHTPYYHSPNSNSSPWGKLQWDQAVCKVKQSRPNGLDPWNFIIKALNLLNGIYNWLRIFKSISFAGQLTSDWELYFSCIKWEVSSLCMLLLKSSAYCYRDSLPSLRDCMFSDYDLIHMPGMCMHSWTQTQSSYLVSWRLFPV